MLVDIAAIPVDDVLKAAVRLNQEFALLGQDDIELGGSQIPHISLLIIDVNKKEVEKLNQAVRRKFTTWPEDLGFGPLHQEKDSLRIFWDGVGNGWSIMHKQALEFGKQYHSEASEKVWLAKAKRFSEIQIEYVRMYGTPYVREYYRSHITLARFQTQVNLLSIDVPRGFQGVQRVGLFEMDKKYRTVREI